MSSSSKSPSNVLKLKSKDGEIFEVDKAAAMQSDVIKNMVEDMANEGGAIGVIPLLMVHSNTLRKIIQWCDKHVDSAEKTDDVGDEERLKNWESEFVDIGMDDLHQLLLAANYLVVEDLLNCAAKKVADMIKARTVEEIREDFGITNDFTPEEEAEIRKQNAWLDL